MLIWCGVIRAGCYKILLARYELRIFLCPVRMLQLEVTDTNYSRSSLCHAHGQFFSVNVS